MFFFFSLVSFYTDNIVKHNGILFIKPKHLSVSVSHVGEPLRVQATAVSLSLSLFPLKI